ncbi:MAG: polymerase, sigma-24 subunit, subfamily [Frankiales bacterium]|nr:polymerase, sigma-24 subunit, subfamily [Frankiales bacterium]
MVAFDDFVRQRAQELRRVAFLLTGDREEADDLVQSALAKALPRWSAITRHEDPFPYVMTSIVNTRRSLWRKHRGRVDSVADVPDRQDSADAFVTRDTQLDLWAAVRRLPAGQRKVVVLRYYEDLTEAEAARILGCSIGTVKSQCAKGMAALRAAVRESGDMSGTTAKGD